jgi:prepilin-type N-terminal cleavage/methylation domain-containing protein
MSFNCFKKQKGFTLVEVVVGTALFLVIALAGYQAYVSLFKLLSANQYKILALNLMNEQFEIARNMSYSDVGIVDGIPEGKIPYEQNLTRGGVDFLVTATIRNIDQEFDGTIGGTPNDLSPADNKFVQFSVLCATCGLEAITMSTNIAPKNLETASTNGALFITVFDANGVPVQGASVHIENNATTSPIVIDDVTDEDGRLQIVDVPPAARAYEITVTKTGYTTDQTYASTVSNPTPTKPHATVALQQVTQVSFQIDLLSTLTIDSMTSNCSAVGNIDFSMVGSKKIGVDVPKYSENLATNSSGTLTLGDMEWDTYRINSIDSAYDLIGLIPLNPAALNPDSEQTVSMIVAPKDPKSLLVTVKDNATGLPLTDATVTISWGSSSSTEITGRGFINQTDWSGGSGQASYTDLTQYYSQDANIDDTSTVGLLSLKDIFGSYPASGSLESSTFDTGSASNFGSIIWSPTSQPPAVGDESVKFQFASNASSSPTSWSFLGPDGTNGTYYTISDTSLHESHDDDRYARYKLILSTASSTATPSVGDIAFTYTSSCIPPGQVIFSGLSTDDYDITVSKTGYSTYSATVSISNNWTEREVNLSP